MDPIHIRSPKNHVWTLCLKLSERYSIVSLKHALERSEHIKSLKMCDSCLAELKLRK